MGRSCVDRNTRSCADAVCASPPIPAIAAQLKQSGKGLVTVVVQTPGQEVEIALPKRVQVNPQLKSTLSALKGVAEIETV